MDEDSRVPRKEFRARISDDQSSKGLPASWCGLCSPWLREYASLRAWFARLRCLLSQPLLAALQGTDLVRIFVDDGGRGGVRGPEKHGGRARECLQPVQAQDDCGVDHLHGGGDRRRS